jgi:hypothetical protein
MILRWEDLVGESAMSSVLFILNTSAKHADSNQRFHHGSPRLSFLSSGGPSSGQPFAGFPEFHFLALCRDNLLLHLDVPRSRSDFLVWFVSLSSFALPHLIFSFQKIHQEVRGNSSVAAG